MERAFAQASDGRGGQTGDVQWTAVEELLLLTVHGTLHVCGWDHADPVEENAMRALERRVLESLGGRDSDGETVGSEPAAGKAAELGG